MYFLTNKYSKNKYCPVREDPGTILIIKGLLLENVGNHWFDSPNVDFCVS
jgi:hypothetical protein